MIRSEFDIYSTLSAGGIVGEDSGLTGEASRETFRAQNFVQTLRIPCGLYREFINRTGLSGEIDSLRERQAFLRRTWLFGESISCVVLNQIVRAMESIHLDAGGELRAEGRPGLYVVHRGVLDMFSGTSTLDTLKPGDFFGESLVLFRHSQPDPAPGRPVFGTLFYRSRGDQPGSGRALETPGDP